ncbi:MAG: 3-deoxy-7-phosphoheptulonate synthase [Clostridia bacterium]|nr:3-deoxy-7-phosphoheptulonate synthase [Clostridia bacterium]
MNMKFYRKLPIPKEIKELYPLTPDAAAVKADVDAKIKDVFEGKSDKFIVIVGPCSADKKEPVLEYLGKLKVLSDKVKDKIIIIPRIFTNKPRTSGCGYMGMLHSPEPNSRPDMLGGIVAIREIHLASLKDYGLPSADEMLYPENHRYLSDLLSYVTVGARSVENQEHRLVASGLNIPVGMKNPISGDFSVMINAISAARLPHTFIYRGWEVESAGNCLAHAVLRGYGKNTPNYRQDDLLRLKDMFDAAKIENPAVIIDANHANSGKDPFEQITVAREVLKTAKNDKFVKGLMIESYLVDGCQPTDGEVFGQSITDPCLGWEKTEKLILEIADKL